MNIIYLKLLIGVSLLILVFLIYLKRIWLRNFFAGANELLILGGSWLVLRLIPFITIYYLFGFEPQSDVEGFWEEASMALEGKIVYKDFWSPYSPLYPYFLAGWLHAWYDPRMIVLVMAIIDGLAVWLTNHFYKGEYSKAERMWKSLIYLALPGSLMLCIVGGQEDVWMWVVVLIAFLYKQKTGNTYLFSLILAVGLLITKAIFVLVIIPLFWIDKQKLKFAIPMMVVGIITLAMLLPVVGWDFLQPLDEAKVLRAPNLLSVLNPLLFNSIAIGSKFWNWAALIFTLILGVQVFERMKGRSLEKKLSHFWVVIFGTMMIVQQSAYSNYIFLFLIPLTFTIIDWENRKQVACLLVYNLLCVIHPSWWWRIGMPVYENLSSVLVQWQYVVDYGMQAGIVILTIYMIRLAFPAAEGKSVSTGNT